MEGMMGYEERAMIALAFYYVVVSHGLDWSDLRRFESRAACERSQRAADEAMRAIWGVSMCFPLAARPRHESRARRPRSPAVSGHTT